MTLCRMSKLCKREEGHQDPREAQGLVDAQLSGAEEGAAISPSSSLSSSSSILSLDTLEEVAAAATPSPPQSPQSAWPSPTAMAAAPWSQSEDDGSSSQGEEGPSAAWEDPEDAESSLQDALHLKMADLIDFLLLKYCTKEPTTKAEMLNMVMREYEDHFPVVFSQACECMQLVFGVDVKEVDPSDHSYVLVTTLGLTYDGMQSGEQSMPKTGLLVLLLGMIVLEGDCAPEEDIWEALSVMGVCARAEHFIYGEPAELLANVWVQEQYVEYRQVPDSDPACYEFLWGPRAHAETSKLSLLEFLANAIGSDPRSFPVFYEEALRDQEERAQARMAPTDNATATASASCSTVPSSFSCLQ